MHESSEVQVWADQREAQQTVIALFLTVGLRRLAQPTAEC